MNTYIVTSAKSESALKAKFNPHTRAAAMQYLQKMQKEFRGIVEAFAAQHPGQVIVCQEDAWLNQTLKIQTTPELAEQLCKLPGIGDVSAPRKITRDINPPQP